MLDNYEDYDGDDAVLVPISQVQCCGEWVGKELVYTPLIWVVKNENLSYWECPVCKGGW